ncbi:MAG TPA: YdcF family protein, partial [Gemmatimonadales bacterium]|nr:YdcF family protein [Gemmatimonadales bacterium]
MKQQRRSFSAFRRGLELVVLAAGCIYTIALLMVLIVSQQDQRHSADAIVVLGAAQYNGRPSPVLRARLDHGLELYREGLAPRIVVTGGVGRGDTTSEA